jgi:hypothetical protein
MSETVEAYGGVAMADVLGWATIFREWAIASVIGWEIWVAISENSERSRG